MKYLLFNTKQQAEDRSAQEAQARGCSSTTLYWWETKETKAGKWAVCIDEPYLRPPDQVIVFQGEEETIPNTSLAGLTASEMSKLKDSVIWPDQPTP